MEREDIERLRKRVSCAAVLARCGWTIDVKASTRRAVKFRRGAGEILIVTHEGRGWFDPLSDAKGDVFRLVRHLGAGGFRHALDDVAHLAGVVPVDEIWRRPERHRKIDAGLTDRWRARRRPWTGSSAWAYLTVQRFLPEATLRVAAQTDRLREGPQGSVWAAHVDAAGALTGWEERGPQWRGFSAGGTKTLFRLGSETPGRICVTEAAIDAMSLAAIEGSREGSLYASTGGGWSYTTDAAIRALVRRADVQLVAATDNNPQGERFAARLREIAEDESCDWFRLRPPAGDWNEALPGLLAQRGKMGRDEGLPHARQRRQG